MRPVILQGRRRGCTEDWSCDCKHAHNYCGLKCSESCVNGGFSCEMSKHNRSCTAPIGRECHCNVCRCRNE